MPRCWRCWFHRKRPATICSGCRKTARAANMVFMKRWTIRHRDWQPGSFSWLFNPGWRTIRAWLSRRWGICCLMPLWPGDSCRVQRSDRPACCYRSAYPMKLNSTARVVILSPMREELSLCAMNRESSRMRIRRPPRYNYCPTGITI